ncbi:MAG: ATP-binding protein [Gammaproteobacteria bacterium]|nr:ATP-binding protein [Gammaproteobacteria bacterium]
MTDSSLLDRIIVDADQCGGHPCIRDTRVPVVDILNLLAAGASPADILTAHPDLELDDCSASLLYAARRLDHPVTASESDATPAPGGDEVRQVRDELLKGRADTDESIRSERATANTAFRQADAQRKLEILIERDRILADRSLELFRERADQTLAEERSGSPPSSDEVTDERLAADDSKDAERIVTDAVLEHERSRADRREESRQEALAAARADRESQRVATDERLAGERSTSDDILADRDAGKAALDVAGQVEMQRKDVFAMVAHDLRNPLHVILASADVLAEMAENDEMRQTADDITVAAGRMGRLLSDLLDVVRIDAGSFPLNKSPNDARELLMEVRRACHRLVESREVNVHIEIPDTQVRALIDRDRVTQLLLNLLGNAIMFTPPGGSVALSVEHSETELEFVVADSGAGIPSEALPNVFKRFWQQDPGHRQGLGLGLYICHAIAQAHGGDISAQSEPGAGSKFRVSLPVH